MEADWDMIALGAAHEHCFTDGKPRCQCCGAEVVIGALRCDECARANRTDNTWASLAAEYKFLEESGTFKRAREAAQFYLDNPDAIPGMLERYEEWRRRKGDA